MFAVSSTTVLAAPDAVEPSDQSAPQTFDVFEFQVYGNSVLDAETVEQTVYPFLGTGRTIDDVEKARQALESLYRTKGYATVLVEIPEQDVEGNRVKLKVVEGTVEKLKITGSRYYSLGHIREGVPALAEGRVPHMPTVQEQIGELAKASADRAVTPILRAGSTPGKMEVELKVDDTLPVHGSVELNSRNTENTSRTRLVGSLRYDNLWQRFHSASLQYQVTPEKQDELEVWSGTYVMPLGLSDLRLALYGIGISSNTQLGTTVGGTSVVGTGNIYGLRLVKPLPGVDDFTHSLTLGLDYKNFDQGVALAGQDRQSTPIDYLPVLLGYDAALRNGQNVTSLNLGLHVGVRGVGSKPVEFSDKRFGAKPDFVYFTGDLKQTVELPFDFRLLARASGQLADSPLISNEQFAVGGPQSVRGYHLTQQLGDDGINLSAELYSPSLLPADWPAAPKLRALAFFDWAYLWVRQPLSPSPSFYKLAAPGAGFRLQLFKHLTGEFDWAYPLYRAGTVDVGNQRVDFRVAYEF